MESRPVLPREKARAARDLTRPPISRRLAAERLRSILDLPVSEHVIRDIEEGRSTKWLDNYIAWLANVSGRPIEWFFDGQPAELALARLKDQPRDSSTERHLQEWQMTLGHKHGSRAYYAQSPFLIAVPAGLCFPSDRDYFAMSVGSLTFVQRIPYRSTVVIQRTTEIPDNAIVAVEVSEGCVTLAGRRILNGRFEYIPLNHPDDNPYDVAGDDAGAVVAVIRNYRGPGDPDGTANIEWNWGAPLFFDSLGGG